MSKKTITIKCSGHTTLPLDLILEFQGKLKKLSKQNLNKLKNNILQNGFIAPIFVWDNAGDYMVLDGHGRVKALISFREDGYDIPLIPVDYIHAKTEKEARTMLLSITGQYGEFDTDELQAWVNGLDDGVAETLRLVDEELKIDDKIDVDFNNEDEIFNDNNDLKEICCPKCGFIWNA